MSDVEDVDGGSGPPASWREVPSAPPRRGNAVVRALLGPALVALAAALIWRAGGRVRTAQAVAVAAIVLGVVVLVSPRIRTRADRIASRITALVATVLSFVLLLPAYYLFVFPMGALIRLLGGRPLDVARDPHRSSYWTVRTDPDGASRPKRMFTDQRGWRPMGFSPSQRRGLVVRTVVATTVVEALLVGGVVLVVHARQNPRRELTGVLEGFTSRSRAIEGYDWAQDAYKEQAEVTDGLVYTSFTGVSIRDYTGTYFNVKNRVRKSYETPLAQTQKPLEVWFFGGSTMFGFDLLRDEHTIPSEIVRLAEAQGIAIHARNYGMAGFVNYQETVLLSLLVTAEKPPDLVVFYDGINDSSMALLNAYGDLNPPGEPGDLGALVHRKGLVSSELRNSNPDPPSPLGLRPDTATKPVTVQKLVDAAAGVYQQGYDLSKILGDRYGFRVLHFWQPDYYTKSPLDPAEVEMAKPLGLDQFRLETMTALWARIRKALPPDVFDISDALNGLDGPVLVDSIHTNEKGSLAVSTEMFQHALPTLRSLTPRG